MRRTAAALVCAAAAAACVPPQGGWDVGALAEREPALRAHGTHRLGDATPYFAPAADGTLALLLCRWTLDRPLRVVVDAEATEGERALVARALRAWEEAIPRLRFAPGAPPDAAELAVGFERAEGEREPEALAGHVSADCALPGGATPPGAERLDARLVFARVRVRRTQPDALARPVPLSEEELLGTLLHELGHALGFQGHARRGDGIMVRETDAVRRAGRRALAGRPLRAPSVAALYRVPSGRVVGWLRPPDDPRRRMALVGDAAVAAGLRGPWVRVGDRAAIVVWGAATGAVDGPALVVSDWPAALRDPARFVLLPSPAAWRLLHR